jgi:hypothetical protein
MPCNHRYRRKLSRLERLTRHDSLLLRCLVVPIRRIDAQELRAAVEKVQSWLDGNAPEPSRADLAAAVRFTVRSLAQDAPGASVEVRVPPFGAVQCIAGPRHTRGTPPNVVQTDPRTWLLLATGRLQWTDALRSGKLQASGTRAGEVAHWLPLLRP